MKTNPTLNQLKKRPALFWDDVNNCLRITYPTGLTEVPETNDSENFDESIFSLDAFTDCSYEFYFIGWL